jgi:hypothetical protein
MAGRHLQIATHLPEGTPEQGRKKHHKLAGKAEAYGQHSTYRQTQWQHPRRHKTYRYRQANSREGENTEYTGPSLA